MFVSVNDTHGDSLLCWFFLLVGWLAEREFGKRSKRNKDKGNFGLRYIILLTHTTSWKGDILPNQSRCVSFEVWGSKKLNAERPFWHLDFECAFFFLRMPQGFFHFEALWGSYFLCPFIYFSFLYLINLILFYLSLVIPTHIGLINM